MLFWHLLGLENAHIRSSMLRFSFGRSLKIAIVIQFLVLMLNGVWTLRMKEIYLRWRRGCGALQCATPSKIQAKA